MFLNARGRNEDLTADVKQRNESRVLGSMLAFCSEQLRISSANWLTSKLLWTHDGFHGQPVLLPCVYGGIVLLRRSSN